MEENFRMRVSFRMSRRGDRRQSAILPACPRRRAILTRPGSLSNFPPCFGNSYAAEIPLVPEDRMPPPTSPPPHPWRLLALITVVLSVWGLADVRNRGVVDPRDVSLHKTDFSVYTEAGAAFFDGRDPYTVTNLRGWGYLYLPLFAMLMAPLHALPPTVGCTVWFFISLATLAGCYFETVRLARLCIPRDSLSKGNLLPDWLVWASLLTTAFPTFNCMQRGQIGILKLYLLLLGLRMALELGGRSRMFLAGVVLALPIVLKITPALPVGFLWWENLLASWRRERLWVRMAGPSPASAERWPASCCASC